MTDRKKAEIEMHNMAIAHYTNAINTNPDSSALYSERGIVYDRIGKPLKAMADFEAEVSGFATPPVEYRADGRSRAIANKADSPTPLGAVQDVPPFFADKRKKKKIMALPCFSLAYNIHGWMLYAQTKSGAGRAQHTPSVCREPQP